MKIEQWFMYTVLVAALPVIIRLICFFFLNNPTGAVISSVDIVFFGLTLNISNINELNALKKRNKNIHIDETIILGGSIFLIVFLSVTLGFTYISELHKIQIINLTAIYISSIFLSIASFVFSWNITLKIQHYNGNN